MLKSMTGFGRGEAPYGDGSVNVEVTTVNGRHLDVVVRGLREYGSLELKTRALVGEKLGRGSVHLNVAVRGTTPTAKRVRADVEFAREYVNEFERLRHGLGVKGGFPAEALTSSEWFLIVEEEARDEEAFTESVVAALEAALAQVVEMRETEGAKLAADLDERLQRVGKLVDDVAARAPEVTAAYRDKLAARVAELASNAAIDEIVRTRAHLRAFADAVAGGGRVGRRLDFLTIEMNREANTVASKAQDAHVASTVIEIKDLLEQIREQVQNVE